MEGNPPVLLAQLAQLLDQIISQLNFDGRRRSRTRDTAVIAE